MTWLNLLSLIRKMPYLGIYVVMFTDVFRTFLKVSGVILLFMISFSFGFYALLQNQVKGSAPSHGPAPPALLPHLEPRPGQDLRDDHRGAGVRQLVHRQPTQRANFHGES